MWPLKEDFKGTGIGSRAVAEWMNTISRILNRWVFVGGHTYREPTGYAWQTVIAGALGGGMWGRGLWDLVEITGPDSTASPPRYASWKIRADGKELAGGVYFVGAKIGSISYSAPMAALGESGDLTDGTMQAVWLELDRQASTVALKFGEDFPDGTDPIYAYTAVKPLWFFEWTEESDTGERLYPGYISAIYDMRAAVQVEAMA